MNDKERDGDEWRAAKYEARRPCKHGHQPVRYVKSGQCVECNAIKGERWRKSMGDLHGLYLRLWRLEKRQKEPGRG